MKGKIKVLAYPLIIAGSFLEVFYVSVRYMKDGIPLPICIVIGISLNVFLMLAVYKKQQALVILLIVFSILNTSSGQTLSLLKQESINKNTGIETSSKQNVRYENQIAQLEKEIIEINVRLSGFDTMEEKAKYRNNIKDDEQTIKDKRAEQARIESLISANGSSEEKEKQETVNATSIYTFYGSIPKWIASDWFTFALHTLLSFFISVMAPFGIAVLEKKEIEIAENPLEKEKPVKQYQRLKTITLEIWIDLMWIGEKREPKDLRIPPAEIVKKWCNEKGYRFDEAEHTERIEQAMTLKLISDTGRLIASKATAIDSMTGQQSLF